MTEETAVVEAPGRKRTFLPNVEGELCVLFGKHAYYVPEDAIESAAKGEPSNSHARDRTSGPKHHATNRTSGPKHRLLVCAGPNKLADAETLTALLATKSPNAWYSYCHSDRLYCLKGKEGTSIYTSFSVPGFESEARILRHVPSAVCDRNLSRWKKALEDEGFEPMNARQQKRFDMLNWRSSDCSRAQLSPEANGFEVMATWPVSARIVNESKKRTEPATESESKKRDRDGEKKMNLPTGISISTDCPEGVRAMVSIDSTAHQIIERDGRVFIITFGEDEDGEDANEEDEE